MKHLVIGSGPAGVIAAETLRKLDPSASVTLFGGEGEAPYSRMALPYYLINQIAEAGTHLRKGDDHFDRLGIHLLNQRIEHIETGQQQVIDESGVAYHYDRLLLATGSTPNSPPIPGIDSPHVHHCWTLADARAILDRAKPGARVVLMGAGFIGCIILESLARRDVELTVVEMGNRMVPRMMDERSGRLIQRWCEAKGVKVLTSTRVEGIEPHDDHLQISTSGHELKADLVISATGVSANTTLGNTAGCDVRDGILINQYMESSVEHIFAAGDVAEGRDFSTGEFAVQAIQPTAADHGRIAASNMVKSGAQAHPGSINMNVLDTMGLVSASFGQWQGVEGGDSVELVDEDSYRYLRLSFEDDRLVGANSLGLTQHIGVLRGLIQTRQPLGEWKEKLMNNPLDIMSAYLGSVQAQG
ncbi:FAD-dependent oxidoreductase [Gammaproteobacteria bacterium]|nr:FAD-dependent oxidoreductase [Gammaproteobacteria bacterium]